MSDHDDLLKQGPRQAPEPETAEEKSRKLGLKTAGGARRRRRCRCGEGRRIGGLGKVFLWLFLWNGVSTAARVGGWIGIAIAVTVVAGAIAFYRRRHA